MQKERLLSSAEKEFILLGLKSDIRIDGRTRNAYRTLKISFGKESGQAEVLLGQTRILVAVSGEIVDPFPDRPTEGFFLFNTEFSPMASPAFEAGRQSEIAIELGRVIERGLRESRAVDSESLCIIAGKKVWQIRVDIHVLDHGGNLIDGSSIATMAALLHFKRPSVSVHDQTLTVHTAQEKPPVALSIHHVPVCVTFAFFDDGLEAVDPSLKEEALMDARMTITMNAHREVCAIQKGGGTPISASRILTCMRTAAAKVPEIIEIIQRAVKNPLPATLLGRPMELSSAHHFIELNNKPSGTTAAGSQLAASFLSELEDMLPVRTGLSGNVPQEEGKGRKEPDRGSKLSLEEADDQGEEDLTAALKQKTPKKRPKADVL